MICKSNEFPTLNDGLNNNDKNFGQFCAIVSNSGIFFYDLVDSNKEVKISRQPQKYHNFCLQITLQLLKSLKLDLETILEQQPCEEPQLNSKLSHINYQLARTPKNRDFFSIPSQFRKKIDSKRPIVIYPLWGQKEEVGRYRRRQWSEVMLKT